MSGEVTDAVAGMEWAPIAGAPFGIEVNYDPKSTPNDAQREALRQLYQRDGLILIRGCKLMSMDEQAEFSRIFGPVPRDQHDTYLISNTRPEGILADLELLFHHDIPFVPAPFLAGCLHAVDVTRGVRPPLMRRRSRRRWQPGRALRHWRSGWAWPGRPCTGSRMRRCVHFVQEITG